MAEYGVSSRAQFFKTPTKELAYVSGGKFIEIYPKNTVSETSKNPIIFEWGPLACYSYNFRDSVNDTAPATVRSTQLQHQK